MTTFTLVVVVAPVLALVALQRHVDRQARKMEGQPIPALTPEIEAAMTRHGDVLLYFFSPKCGPCRTMTPRIERVTARQDNPFNVDASRTPELATILRVQATPTTLPLAGDRIVRVNLSALAEEASSGSLASSRLRNPLPALQTLLRCSNGLVHPRGTAS